jgi:murein DD-endopeptidase MepM/ murein hydrolase activator NlpD
VRPANRESNALRAEVLPIPKTLEIGSVSLEIDADTPSLFAATTSAGERPDLAVAIASIFSGEVDFNSEVQPGDRITVVFERFHREGRPATTGELIAGEYEFADGSRRLRLFRYSVDGGARGYYDEEGRSSKRFFLKSPLKFEPRITSAFSMRRRHPVLHTTRAHRGVDYGAPTGAPVVAVAAGTVVSATYDSANGRMVRLRHASGYQTYYLHLSRFEKGIRAGDRVAQGDVIGYVGSTGLSTGPHLHYGLTKNGAFVDPVAEHRRMPPGEPIPAGSMAAFGELRDRMQVRLNEARGAAAPGPRLASGQRRAQLR